MQLTVVKKISYGFGLFGCLLLLISVFSYIGLNDIKASAVMVAEEMMPIQAGTVEVKSDILALSVITANGFYLDNKDKLAANAAQFDEASNLFVTHSNILQTQLKSEQLTAALAASNLYLQLSKDMYVALREQLQIQQAMLAKQEESFAYADESSALLLDLTFFDNDDGSLDTIIGVGTSMDNKLLTLSEVLQEFAQTSNADISENLIGDAEYQVSNLEVDLDYLKTITESVDVGDTITLYTEQFEGLKESLLGAGGLVALQREKLAKMALAFEHREAANKAQQQAIEGIESVFAVVNTQTLAGQESIINNVNSNLVKNAVVSILGLIIAVVLAVVATRSIARPLAKIDIGLNRLSSGDLSRNLDESGNDEFSDLANKVNKLTNNLRSLVGNILTQEDKLESMTKSNVALGNKSLSLADVQREKISDIAVNTQAIRDTSQSNLAQIDDAMTSLKMVTQQSNDIASLVDQNLTQSTHQADQARASAAIIEQLDENSRNIGSILDVIKTIAEQTNLLALNAAIEAARAGELGRGFAVVADEVRTLANRTHDSTEEIESMITRLQQDASQAVAAIAEGKEQAEQSVELGESVSQQVRSSAEIIQTLLIINENIVTDTQRQDALLADISTSLERIVDLANSSAEGTREANGMTENIAQEMDKLHQAVLQFKL